MVKKIFCALTIAGVMFSACINSRTPPPQTDPSVPPTVDEPTPAAEEPQEVLMKLFGIGNAVTVNKNMALNWARNMAMGSVAEQMSGLNFSYNLETGEINVESKSQDVVIGGARVTAQDAIQNGNQWNAWVVLTAEVPVILPQNQTEILLPVEVEIAKTGDLYKETAKAVLSSGDWGGYSEEMITGQIFLTDLNIEYNKTNKNYRVAAEVKIYYK